MADKDLEKKPSPQEALLIAFRADMENIVPYLQSLLPYKGGVERFVKMTRYAIMRTPDLLTCNRKSLLLALIWCAEKNLEPGVEDGVWLIPFKGIVTPIPAYKGLIKRATETESIKDIQPINVYSLDVFEYTLGTDFAIVHKPPKLGAPRGDLIGAYCKVTMPDGSIRFTLPLSKDEIEKIRNAGAAWKTKPGTGPWADWTDAMFMKTAIKQGLKYVPVKPAMRDLLHEDTRIEAGDTVGLILTQTGADLPGGLAEEDVKGSEKKKEPLDTSSFDDLVAAKMLTPERMARVKAGLEEIAQAQSTEKKPVTVDEVKIAGGARFEEFWAAFEKWEASKYPEPPETKTTAGEPATETEPASGAAETEGGPTTDEDDWGDCRERAQKIFDILTEKGVPQLTSGIMKLEDITPENIDQTEELANSYKPPRKKK